MSPSFRTARWVGLASVFVLVAAAAFGAKLWHKAPRDFFLSLAKDSDTAEPTLPAASTEPVGTAGSFARLGGGAASGSSGDTGSRGAASAQSAAAAGLLARQSAAGGNWTPWGNSSLRRGLNGSSASSGSAALGGLWHTMSPFGGHGAGAADTPATVTAHAEPKPAAAKPTPVAKPSRPAPSPSSAPPAAPSIGAPPATAGSAVPAPSVSAAPADPGGGLGEHQTPLPEVGGGSGGSVGGPIGGGAGSPGGSMPGGSSSNPEPGTIALVGTGVLALVGALRKRRV